MIKLAMTETLKKYLKGKSRESFAQSVGTTKNYINLLVVHLRRPSSALALKIERATGGAVSRDELLFPELYLETPASPTAQEAL
jgi:DNA-binding transcriptional regulator YdaS (Cro superfamily)